MVAGDTKRVIVIKNISSNLIEEAILILKSEPGIPEHGGNDRQSKSVRNSRKDFILKEAESIINEYIREHKLQIGHGRRIKNSLGIRDLRVSVNTLINFFFVASIAVLIYVIIRLF